MKGPERERNPEEKLHTEDMVFKAAGEFFGEKALKLFGISEKMRRIAPTETIRLDARRMHEDFNMEMENGEWYHFEFESDSIRKKDLRRFREYEASVGNIHQVDVITYVVCTADVKMMMTGYRFGISTYRVRAIRFNRRNADRLFVRLSGKGRISKKDLLEIVFSPLMGGKMPLKERIRKGFDYLSAQKENVDREECRKMQAMLYMLAVKFLPQEEWAEIKEEIGMTALGQMLVNDGIQQGIQQGIRLFAVLSQRLLQDGRTKELELAAKDDAVRKRLCQEYGLTPESVAEAEMKKWDGPAD